MTTIRISDEGLAYAARRFGKPQGLAGTINQADAAFLFDMLVLTRPLTVAEIGVASGVSTAFLSTLLSDRLRQSRLYSFEILDVLPGEVSQPVGYYLREVFSDLPDNLLLTAGTGSMNIVASPHRPDQFDFVFLDACHSHPWPCNDLLAILGIVTPGAWVVLHDTRLPIISREFATFGPLYLYQTWPGEKLAPAGGNTNIGAIRLFENPRDSVRALVDCCHLPWQGRMRDADWSEALNTIASVDAPSFGLLSALIQQPPMAKRTKLRNCEILIRGANPWSRIPLDIGSEPMVLHANQAGEPVMSVLIRGFRRRECNGVIFPSIVRSEDATEPLLVNLALRAFRGTEEVFANHVLRDDDPCFSYLRTEPQLGEDFTLEISISVAGAGKVTRGAWAKFEAIHFV